MSGDPTDDLEQRLGTALARASDDAPTSAGLADRVRAHRRRQHRGMVAAAVVGTAAAVVVGVVPGLQGHDLSGEIADSEAPPRWQTVNIEPQRGAWTDRLEMDLPAGWGRIDTTSCEFPVRVYGPSDTDPCDVSSYAVALYGAGNFDSLRLPGVLTRSTQGWDGHVVTGEVVVAASDAGRAATRRMLASVRLEDDPDPDVAVWSTETLSGNRASGAGPGITVDVPADPGVIVRLRGFADCVDNSAATQRPDGRWAGGVCRDRVVTAIAPTQALADVVTATVRGY